jgi:hypothetical protein
MVNTGYFLGKLRGRGKSTARFDTRRGDATPPTLTSFKLLNSEGIPASRFTPGAIPNLAFSAADYAYDRSYDYVAIDSTRVYVKRHGAQQWQRVNSITTLLHNSSDANGYRPIGYLFNAALADVSQFDSTAVDLKIFLADRRGNTSEWTLEPAFAIGDFVTPVEDSDSDSPKPGVPVRYALYANYPNPFNPHTIIQYDLPENTKVTLEIYNVLGQKVRTLVDAHQAAGSQAITWNGQNDSGQMVDSGIYFYRIKTLKFQQSRKMAIIR